MAKVGYAYASASKKYQAAVKKAEPKKPVKPVPVYQAAGPKPTTAAAAVAQQQQQGGGGGGGGGETTTTTTQAPPPLTREQINALITTDPRYTGLTSGLLGSGINAFVAFGDPNLTTIGTDPITGAPITADAATVEQARNNPYSTLHQLAQAHQQQAENITNALNAHGLLFSGGYGQGQVNEATRAGQAEFDARQQYQQGQDLLQQQRAQAYAQVYGDYAANPPDLGPTTTTTTTTPSTSSSAPAPTLAQINAAAPANLKVPKAQVPAPSKIGKPRPTPKPKPPKGATPKTPKIGGYGVVWT